MYRSTHVVPATPAVPLWLDVVAVTPVLDDSGYSGRRTVYGRDGDTAHLPAAGYTHMCRITLPGQPATAFGHTTTRLRLPACSPHTTGLQVTAYATPRRGDGRYEGPFTMPYLDYLHGW